VGLDLEGLRSPLVADLGLKRLLPGLQMFHDLVKLLRLTFSVFVLSSEKKKSKYFAKMLGIQQN